MNRLKELRQEKKLTQQHTASDCWENAVQPVLRHNAPSYFKPFPPIMEM